MGEQSGYLLRFATQISRSATIVRASLPPIFGAGGIGRSGECSDAAVRSAMVSFAFSPFIVLCGVSSSSRLSYQLWGHE